MVKKPGPWGAPTQRCPPSQLLSAPLRGCNTGVGRSRSQTLVVQAKAPTCSGCSFSPGHLKRKQHVLIPPTERAASSTSAPLQAKADLRAMEPGVLSPPGSCLITEAMESVHCQRTHGCTHTYTCTRALIHGLSHTNLKVTLLHTCTRTCTLIHGLTHTPHQEHQLPLHREPTL